MDPIQLEGDQASEGLENAKKGKKVRRKNWSPGETMAVIEFVNRHKLKLFGKGKHCSSKVEERKKKYWRKASNELKGMGFLRDAQEIQRKWGDLKQRALKYKSERVKTGGGVPMAGTEAKPVLEAVLGVICREAREGVVGPEEEAGFSSSQSTTGSQNEVACGMFSGMTDLPPLPWSATTMDFGASTAEAATTTPSSPTSPTPMEFAATSSTPRPASKPTNASSSSLPAASCSGTCAGDCTCRRLSATQQLVELEKERIQILNRHTSFLERIAISLEKIANK